MSSRLHAVAEENQAISIKGRYTAGSGASVAIGSALAAAVSGTRCHQPDERLDPPRPRSGEPSSSEPRSGEPTRIEVTGEKSLDAARRLCDSGPGEVAVLTFASARNPGGGYLRGAKAQEEDLCRESLLHPCLLQAQHDYYEPHRASDDLLYSDRVIWSPRVPVHRGGGVLLGDPYSVSFLTSPAPNAGEVLRRDPDAGPRIDGALHRRAGRVLAVAAHHGVRRLVLGAWGCGVFRNDPGAVARSFRCHLDATGDGAFHRAFDEVVFAVWDRTTPSANRRAFDASFAVPLP
jgi:uncharacterized protein (TIGR02452 family)